MIVSTALERQIVAYLCAGTCRRARSGRGFRRWWRRRSTAALTETRSASSPTPRRSDYASETGRYTTRRRLLLHTAPTQLNSAGLDWTGRRRVPVHLGPDLQTIVRFIVRLKVKVKGSPYSITERRVPELIPVLGSQPAGDVSHKPGGRLPLLAITFRQACSYPRNP